MKDEEKKELEQEYENLKLLASFHEAYGVPELSLIHISEPTRP